MKNLVTYTVVPSLPKELNKLKELAYNLLWEWNEDIRQVFPRMDAELWERVAHNPVALLGQISQKKLELLANNKSFLAHVDRAYEHLQNYLNEENWFKKKYPDLKNMQIAYFCAEFGLTECLPIYSGGLGILSGDHLKSASELGLPLVAVGLLYQQGYFRQYLNIDGWQQESYIKNDFYNMPIQPVKKNDQNLIIEVDFPGRKVAAQVWYVNVGRIKLYLLDTNLPRNAKADQGITGQLYGGDVEMRIQQELILGIGGVKAIRSMGYAPNVCHMNEGHSAFLTLEKLRIFMQEYGLNLEEAGTAITPCSVFTTHTPVEAGIDQFAPALIEKYLSGYCASLGVSTQDILWRGRANPAQREEYFNMAYLALSSSAYHNGVSKLHGEVSRKMWQKLWPGVTVEDVPIGHVTNGVHAHTWISSDMLAVYNRYLGAAWREDPSDHSVWDNVIQIPAEELWNTHERRRERLISFARKKLKEQLTRQGANKSEIDMSMEVLDPNALTIGFARRFATYKRGNLILKNPERLRKLLTNKEFPVQLVFAGKAHPKDEAGKNLIRQIVQFAKSDPALRNRIVFLDDYDLVIARHLVQGVDVWLNTPRRPMEASGTSGMKAALNGVLNLSCLDGWWDEAYAMDQEVGWAIGKGEDYQDPAYQDTVESNALYDLLEKEIVPLFYERGDDHLPRGWIQRMKKNLQVLGPFFNTNRMVEEYLTKYYLPAYTRFSRLSANNFQSAKDLSMWKRKLRENWHRLRVSKVESNINGERTIGDKIQVDAWIDLGGLSTEDLRVEVFYGLLDDNRDIVDSQLEEMHVQSATAENGLFHYAAALPCDESGAHGFTVRILPKSQDLANPLELRLIHWQ